MSCRPDQWGSYPRPVKLSCQSRYPEPIQSGASRHPLFPCPKQEVFKKSGPRPSLAPSDAKTPDNDSGKRGVLDVQGAFLAQKCGGILHYTT